MKRPLKIAVFVMLVSCAALCTVRVARAQKARAVVAREVATAVRVAADPQLVLVPHRSRG